MKIRCFFVFLALALVAWPWPCAAGEQAAAEDDAEDDAEDGVPGGFQSGERRVGVAYHWHYRYPDEGFQDATAVDGDPLRYHVGDARDASPLSTGWHRRQFEAMVDCGLDFVLPEPAANPIDFVDRVLPHMIGALAGSRDDAALPLRVGLRIDVGLIVERDHLSSPARELVDLANPWGRRRVAEIVTSFYGRLPVRHWASIDGRPIVVFDAANPVRAYGADLFDFLRAQFRAGFGVDPYLVAEASWKIEADGRFFEGGALAGPTPATMICLGPGFDDSRRGDTGHPVRDRENGRFYEWSWNEALRARGDFVLVDSWNGLHDGTAICATREFGDRYRDLTRTWIRRYKNQSAPRAGLELSYPHPRPRPDWFWGKAAAGATEVALDVESVGSSAGGGAEARARSAGITVVEPQDGRLRRLDVGGKAALMTLGVRPRVSRYMYFRVSDYYIFDEPCEVEIEVRYHDSGVGGFELHYDSTAVRSSHQGAYRNAGRRFRDGADVWRTAVFRLPDARFASRQNGDADFRLAAFGSDLLVSSVRVRRIDR